MKYILAEACQNTFIIVDWLDRPALNFAEFEKVKEALIYEDRDDALILTQGFIKNGSAYATMLVLGRDGEFGEFCGNGSRACAAYLYSRYSTAKHIYLTTKKGVHRLEQHGDSTFSVKLPLAQFEINPKFIADSQAFLREYSFQYVEVIEPHLVFKGNISDESLFALGQDLNKRKDLFPSGINLNAYHALSDGKMFVKTYERGVQRLTQSCGTGSMSCAALSKQSGTIQVMTPGGPLEIKIEPDGIVLKGPVKICSDSSKIALVG